MQHLTEDVLESYELGRLAQPAADAVEEHLLVCEPCRAMDGTMRTFVTTLRSGLRKLDPNVVFWQLHLTDEGLIEVWIEKTPQGRWLSRRQGRFYDGGVDFAMKVDALRESVDSFTRLFPEHKCGEDCILG